MEKLPRLYIIFEQSYNEDPVVKATATTIKEANDKRKYWDSVPLSGGVFIALYAQLPDSDVSE